MLTVAFRNLWRVPRRTLLTLAALTLGVAAIVFLSSYRESTFTQLLHTITSQLVGHVQIHGRGYQDAPELTTVVKEPELIEASLARVLPGVSSERRVIGAALAGANENSAGAVVMGLQSGQGATLLTLTQGHALSPAASHEAVIGLDLANQLSVKVGDELVLLGQAVDGSVANDRYRIVGLGDAGSSELNATGVFLHLADAQDFFGLGASVHQLVLKFSTDSEDLSGELGAVRGALDLKALEALSWNELLPELRKTLDSKRKSQHSLDFVVMLLVALGVLNVMTMSTFERTREFGVMMAVGTRPSGIVRLVLLEAALQGLIGLILGVLVAFALVVGIGTLDLSSFAQGDMLGVRMPSLVHLTLKPAAIVSAGITVMTTMLVAGLLPALRASRLEPATAVREN